MLFAQNRPEATSRDRIDVKQEYELCVWARYFNVSEKRVKEAVAAVGDRADRVGQHLGGRGTTSARSERPSA